MICENVFCVYNKKGECILEEIEIDIRGGCKECIYVDIKTRYLDEAKRRIFADWGENYENE